MKFNAIAVFSLALEFAVGGTIRNSKGPVSVPVDNDNNQKPDIGILLTTASSEDRVETMNNQAERNLATNSSIGSCVYGTDVCERAGDHGSFVVGDYACNGDWACLNAGRGGSFVAGSSTCNGRNACVNAGQDYGDFVAGNSSCYGEDACAYATSFYGNFTVRNNACRGMRSCRAPVYMYQHSIEIGDGSCLGEDSCRMQGTGLSGSPGPGSYPSVSFTIGKNSCTCPECCLYLKDGSYIGDEQCNEIADGCSNQTAAVVKLSEEPSSAPSSAPSPAPSSSPSSAPSPSPSSAPSMAPTEGALDCSSERTCSRRGEPPKYRVCVEKNLEQRSLCKENFFVPKNPSNKVLYCGSCV